MVSSLLKYENLGVTFPRLYLQFLSDVKGERRGRESKISNGIPSKLQILAHYILFVIFVLLHFSNSSIL